MKTTVIAGGTSGLGLEAAKTFSAQGHRVVLLGRNEVRGAEAVANLSAGDGSAIFHAVDLSTHSGVRNAARALLDEYECVDALLHTSGVLTFDEMRTSDGLHPFFAVNFLSRYHLTQLMLPALRRADRGKVVMLTSKFSPNTPIDFDLFPDYRPFKFLKMSKQAQAGNHHYAAHLGATEPGIIAGVLNAGAVNTGIWRETPWLMRSAVALMGPLFFDSLESAAANPVAACLRDDWVTGTYWPSPGKFDRRVVAQLDAITTARVIETCQELTGA